MMLSDGDIAERLQEGDLVIEPLDDPDVQIQPASVDVRLGREFLEFDNGSIPYIDPKNQEDIDDYVTETIIPEDGEYVLHPTEFVLGTTIEKLELPTDLIGHVNGRSSLGRIAIVVHATAGVCDPGFRGQITLELSNLGTTPVVLTPNMRIAQITFTQLKTPAKRPYGADRDSKYQDQDGPQVTRLKDDFEFSALE